MNELILGHCYGHYGCVPPKFTRWNPNTKDMVLEGGACGR